MRKLMNLLMMSCRKATALIVKREDSPLSRFEKIRLSFHLMMCDACSAFSSQSKVIHKVMEKEDETSWDVPGDSDIPEDLKEKIISNLK